jgi:CubicO group peptidase (beta-lactamase class C family)
MIVGDSGLPSRQPIIELHSRKVVRHELLLRMVARDGEIVEPRRVLPAAEQFDLIEELADWDRCTSLLAAQTPWWEPGTESGYHAVTQGYLVGEVIRRITGLSMGQFFKETVADPLGADFHIGLPPEADARVAPLIPPPPADLSKLELPELALRTLTNPPITAEVTAEEWWRRAEIPAANGHGNARSVAAIQSIVACGGEARGTRLLSEAGLAAIFEEQSNGRDLVLNVPLRFGMGFGLASETMPMGPALAHGADTEARSCSTTLMPA